MTKAPLGLPISVVVVVELVLLVVGSSVVVVGAAVLVVGAAVLVVGAAVVVVGAAVLVVGAAVVVVGAAVLVVGAPVVVVVEVPPQTNAPPGELGSQASQQLVVAPTQLTPLSASHASALGWISHSTSSPSTRQQVTAPGARPQIERAAHTVTSLWHSLGRTPVATRCLATSFAQRTYAPCVSELSQPH